MHGGDEKCLQNSSQEVPNGRANFGYLGVDSEMILKWI
jgi:hypothetical protein